MCPLRALSLLSALALAACSATSGPSAPPSVTPSATPTTPQSAMASPTASPAPASPSSALSSDPGSGEVIVTFRTAGDEEFRILLTDAPDIRMAERLLAGDEEGLFPNGLVVRGGDGGVNLGYSWHIDPESVEFAQFSTEACDGRPSYVEDGSHTIERFCPWTAVVVEVEPAG